MLGGEPWCFTPEQIGKLTDWQIWELYVRPVVDRQREERRRRRGPRKRDKFGGVPSREEFIAGGLHMGLTEEHCAAEYDTWAATEEGQRITARRARVEAREAAKAAHKTEEFE